MQVSGHLQNEQRSHVKKPCNGATRPFPGRHLHVIGVTSKREDPEIDSISVTKEILMRLLACFCAVTLFGISALAESKYSIQDLKALNAKGSWEEMVEHLEDIPPSKRDAEWSTLTENACANFMASLELNEKNSRMALFASDRILSRYPQLKQSKTFMAKRAEVLLKSFELSYGYSSHSSGNDPWLDALKEFVKSDTLTVDLPQRAAQLVQKRLAAACAWPLWKTAIDRGSQVCQQAEFQNSILAAFEEGVWKDEIAEVAKTKCWAELKTPLLTRLEKSEATSFPEAVCPVLKEKSVKSQKCVK
jgi:hypothetical protein